MFRGGCQGRPVAVFGLDEVAPGMGGDALARQVVRTRRRSVRGAMAVLVALAAAARAGIVAADGGRGLRHRPIVADAPCARRAWPHLPVNALQGVDRIREASYNRASLLHLFLEAFARPGERSACSLKICNR
jgi:hypothetical protein